MAKGHKKCSASGKAKKKPGTGQDLVGLPCDGIILSVVLCLMVADEWRENFRMSRSSFYKHGHLVKPLTKIEKSSYLVSIVETERKINPDPWKRSLSQQQNTIGQSYVLKSEDFLGISFSFQCLESENCC